MWRWLPGPRASERARRAEAKYPPKGRFVTVDGRRVHADVDGAGPDLVLIHGANGNTRDWTFDVTPRLRDRYRIIAFDRPGLGYSDQVTDGFVDTPAQQATQLQRAAAALGADRPIVVGHSYGGAIALSWALDHPGTLSALVLLGAASNPWPGGLGWLYAINSTRLGGKTLVPLIAAYATYGYAQRVLDRIFAPQDPPPGYDDYVGIGLVLRPDTLRANARQVNGLYPHIVAMAKRYGAIAVPTEIVHGTEDRVVPLSIHSEPLVRQIPGAVLTRLQGIGHMPHHSAPGDTDAAIDRAAQRAGLR
jgi:pimeloyl-ACP methyl ester carboxylesterase